MKKILIAAMILLVPSLAVASGGIGFRNLDGASGYREVCYGFQGDPSGVADVDGGQDGVIVYMPIANDSTPLYIDGGNPVTTPTTSIPSMPYPGRVSAVVMDQANADTSLACTSVTVSGYDLWGTKRNEKLSAGGSYAVSETATVTSKHVYTRLTRVEAVGCGENGAYPSSTSGADGVKVFVDNTTVGLPAPVRRWSDIVKMCIKDQSDSNISKCVPANNGSTTDIQSVASAFAYGGIVDVSGAIFGTHGGGAETKETAINGDQLCIGVRPSY